MRSQKSPTAVPGDDQPEIPLNDAFCTTREAAVLLGVSLRTAQLWVDNGTLQAWKTTGGHRRVLRESVNRLLRGERPQREGAAEEAGESVCYLARQPILDSLGRIVAYELLYRCRATSMDEVDDTGQAAAQVIAYAFSDLSMGISLGNCRCHINVAPDLLQDEALQLLPRGQTILELDSREPLDDAAVELCRRLKIEGHQLALDRYVPDGPNERLLPLADIVKLDVMSGDPARLPDLVKQLRERTPARLLADGVETPEIFQQCRNLGFDLFQGYYFAHPHMLAGARANPSHTALLHLLNLVMGDAGNREIEAALKTQPTLCYSLLRLVNSASMGLNRRIGTISEVINILGRRQLQRWAHLLLFAQLDETPFPSPLLQTASLRGKLMEGLAAAMRPGQTDFQDRAFMTGILSLVDALLKVPMPAVLAKLSLADDVNGALLNRSGDLGQILAICEVLEDQGDSKNVAAIMARQAFDADVAMMAQAEALRWANALGETTFH